MTTRALRQNVFICYSHEDTKYLKLFELKLQPAVGDKLSVWSDQEIAAGADWHSEIERQLDTATAALLLVSDTFLSSSYIRTVELPTILERHAKEGLDVFWVPISWILEKQVALSTVQAAWPLRQPLMALSKSKRDEAVKKICEQVLSGIGQLTYVSEERVDRLLDDVQRFLPPHSLKAAEPIGDGDFAVVYRGEMDGRAVAVKALVDCPMRNHLKGFSKFVQRRRERAGHPRLEAQHSPRAGIPKATGVSRADTVFISRGSASRNGSPRPVQLPHWQTTERWTSQKASGTSSCRLSLTRGTILDPLESCGPRGQVLFIEL